jgi:UDP-4-amino-4,6-dideoxy-N-acetyl-beta-L-altrosamine N-acetyltransferase
MNIIFKKFQNLDKFEHINLLKIRNSNNVRINTKSKKIILWKDHINWIKTLQANNQYYAIYYNNEIIGSISILNIDDIKKECLWGIYCKENIHPILSSVCTYIIIDKIFNELNIKILILEVEKTNTQAYKFDLSFGFEEYDTINNYIQMSINNIKWNNHKNIGYMKVLQKKIKKIEYKFI